MEDRAELPFIGSTCAGAAACLIGVISCESLVQAIRDELATLGADIIDENLEKAASAFQIMKEHEGCVKEGEEVSAAGYEPPDWVEIPFEDARKSAPVIHAGLTSVEVKTGLWRTMRPVIDYERCKHCWWVCSSFCPDSAILVSDERLPKIDYDHCKGCMVCVAQCPSHAIEAIPEYKARAEEVEGGLT